MKTNAETVRWVAMLCVLAAAVSGCGRPPGPIALEHGAMDASVSIASADDYAVSLRYPYATPAERAVSWALATQRDERAPFDVWLRVTAPNGHVEFEGVVTAPKLRSWGADSLNADLVKMPMSPGTYRIAAEIRNGSVELNVPMQIAVWPAYQGK